MPTGSNHRTGLSRTLLCRGVGSGRVFQREHESLFRRKPKGTKRVVRLAKWHDRILPVCYAVVSRSTVDHNSQRLAMPWCRSARWESRLSANCYAVVSRSARGECARGIKSYAVVSRGERSAPRRRTRVRGEGCRGFPRPRRKGRGGRGIGVGGRDEDPQSPPNPGEIYICPPPGFFPDLQTGQTSLDPL